MNSEQVLAIKMGGNDAEAETVKEYLKKLLTALWTEGESFNGKKPFGNSGWEYDLYSALARAGAIRADIDENGDIDELDVCGAEILISDAINSL
jgi:hypothetical protein